MRWRSSPSGRNSAAPISTAEGLVEDRNHLRRSQPVRPGAASSGSGLRTTPSVARSGRSRRAAAPPISSDMLIPVILSGGSGTRLWPLSRESYPKQLLPLVGKGTMLQETLARLERTSRSARRSSCATRVTASWWPSSCAQLGIRPQAIVLEPVGRNTAPAVAAAHGAVPSPEGRSDRAAGAAGRSRDPRRQRRSARPSRVALPAAQAGKLVTFGVVPNKPETGYGYIRRGAADGAAFRIAQFVEKPDCRARGPVRGESASTTGTAACSCSGPTATWTSSSGWRATSTARARRSVDGCQARSRFHARADQAEFGACPSDSIDYAVMEKTGDAVVVPLDAGWSDVGSWSALHEAIPADERRQRHARRRADRRHRGLLSSALDEPPGGDGRPEGSRRGRNQGRRPGRARRTACRT